MNLLVESDNLNDYLRAVPPIIDWSAPLIRAKIQEFKSQATDDQKQAELAFEFTRDKIKHSFDHPACTAVTITAEDALLKKEGICFAKAHLLASFLRGMGIPAGFCYQLKNNAKAGYVLHGLNAIYLEEAGWFRVDPRGNKTGINAQFSTEKEQLAYPIDPAKGEKDYPYIFPEPLTMVIDAMKNSKDAQALFYNRPKGI